jgi:hypothetical protein
MFMAGAMAAQEGDVGRLRQVFLITEAWVSAGEAGQPPHDRPSLDPRRVEVLAISSYTAATQGTRLALYEMLRCADGALHDLVAFEVGEAARAESPLLEAFVEGFARAGPA